MSSFCAKNGDGIKFNGYHKPLLSIQWCCARWGWKSEWSLAESYIFMEQFDSIVPISSNCIEMQR